MASFQNTQLFHPSPRTWSTDQVIKAPYLRSDLGGTVQLGSIPPVFIGRQSQTAQSIPSGGPAVTTSVLLNTEIADSQGGHLVNLDSDQYFGMFSGWYLVEGACAYASVAAAAAGCAVGGQSGGSGGGVPFGGDRGNLNSTSNTSFTAAKLMRMIDTGSPRTAGNDFIQLYANQASGSALNTAIGNRFCQLTATYICAGSGTTRTTVPANPSWPVPPSGISSAFMNTNVRDACQFLLFPPIMEFANTTGGTLATSAAFPVAGPVLPLNSQVVDNFGAFSNATNTWTAPVEGVYYAYGCVALITTATTTAYGAGLTVSSANYNSGTTTTIWGGTIAAVNNGTGAATVRRRLRLNAGDTVALSGIQNDTGGHSLAFSTSVWQARLITVWAGS